MAGVCGFSKKRELLIRLQSKEINEIILALNPNSEGDATSVYLINVKKIYQ